MTTFPAVYCMARCHPAPRYIGAFIGRGQCAGCKAWVDAVEKLQPLQTARS